MSHQFLPAIDRANTTSTAISTSALNRTKMPRLKHFVVEKSKLITWHFEKVPAKEIAARFNWDVSTVHRIIRQNQGLPITVMPLLPRNVQGVKGTTPTCRRTGFSDIFSVIHLKQPKN
jgi:hypothetical protein